jgi:hypothetical protein
MGGNMGGNALDFETKRLAKVDYQQVRDHVLTTLISQFTDSRRIKEIPAYRSKPDFGDLDVLFETFAGDAYNVKEIITTLFSPKQIVQNGHVYSFDYDNFQVDLILTPTAIYQTSVDYFSQNDRGNLIGRISKKLGFKYGHDGLVYMFRKDDLTHSVYAEATVSTDTKQIMKFLDLDYDTFANGHDTLEEMFRFVASSKYFHPDIYLLQNRNHTSRTRDKKRKTYNQFLTWCAETPNLNAYPWTHMREQDGYAGKPEFLKMALETFPEFAKKHAEIVKKHFEYDLVHKKFNGDVIREITGFEGKQLGEFMQHLLNSNGGKEAVHQFLLPKTTEEVREFVLVQFENFKKTLTSW